MEGEWKETFKLRQGNVPLNNPFELHFQCLREKEIKRGTKMERQREREETGTKRTFQKRKELSEGVSIQGPALPHKCKV